MKFARFTKSTKGKSIFISLLTGFILFIIIYPIAMLSVSKTPTKGFTLKTIGSNSVVLQLNSLVIEFQEQMLNSTGLVVNYQPAHNGSSDAFSEDSKYAKSYIGFQSRGVKTSELQNWGYEPEVDSEGNIVNDNCVFYSNWEYDALTFIVNPDGEQNAIDLNSSILKEIYQSSDTFTYFDVSNNLQFKFDKAYNRPPSSGSRQFFEEFIEWNQEVDRYGKNQIEIKTNEDVIHQVRANENSIGYASMLSVMDSNSIPFYDDVVVASINGVFPTVETVRSGTYNAKREFNMFFRVEADDSAIWERAMFDPLSGEWNTSALTALESKDNDQKGAFLFYNWMLYSDQISNGFILIGGSDLDYTNPMTSEDMVTFVNYTGLGE